MYHLITHSNIMILDLQGAMLKWILGASRVPENELTGKHHENKYLTWSLIYSLYNATCFNTDFSLRYSKALANTIYRYRATKVEWTKIRRRRRKTNRGWREGGRPQVGAHRRGVWEGGKGSTSWNIQWTDFNFKPETSQKARGLIECIV